jgi:uracil-DNA glycosylase
MKHPADKQSGLKQMAQEIDTNEAWWRFPTESKIGVGGFMGDGQIFIVGEQPSFSDWDEDHEHRRALYDLLASLEAGSCHLTDLYKRRGSVGEFRNGPLPEDFDEHLDFFLRELELLEPTLLLAMGGKTHDLLTESLPGLMKRLPGLTTPDVRKVWHFGSVAYGKKEEFQESLCAGLQGTRRMTVLEGC